MKTKFQKTIIAAVGMLFLPMAAFASIHLNDQSWGLGATVNPDGSVGISAAIGSPGAFGGGWALANPYGLPQGSILGIISNLLFWLLAIFAILGIVGFVLSGIFYLVSAGDDGMIEKGKSGMKYSILGIIVGLSGYLIMQAVALLLSGSSSNF